MKDQNEDQHNTSSEDQGFKKWITTAAMGHVQSVNGRARRVGKSSYAHTPHEEVCRHTVTGHVEGRDTPSPICRPKATPQFGEGKIRRHAERPVLAPRCVRVPPAGAVYRVYQREVVLTAVCVHPAVTAPWLDCPEA